MASSSGGHMKRKPHYSCMEQPSLVKKLRGILSEYPDGGQILKEMIQNADDAGATELKIMLESRRINRDLKEDSPLFTKFFQAPALCIYNDAEFTDDDWRGIRMIDCSVKEEDCLKVGRFGLGFKSVFHITDYPCVISGNTVLLMDPQRPKDEVNATLKINEIHEIEGIDTSDILRAVGGKYGFDETVIKNGYFRGTMFWFPLRENASSISENLYNISKVEQLFGSLHAESSSILIFLKSLMCLHLLKMTPSGYEDHVLIVQIQDEEEIRLKRKSFFSCFKSASLKNDVACVFKMTIKETTHESTQFTQWLVITYYIVNNASNDFRRLIQSPKLGLSPCVGVAAKMQPLSAVEGHIFCFLPLPKEGTKLTGLPFHVNGFFALSQNRHHLKWATDGQDDQYVNDDILWNKKLLSEALPLAYQKAIDTAIKMSVTKRNPITLVNGVYLWIAKLENILEKWKPFFKDALQSCAHKTIVFCEEINSWKCVSEVVFTTFKELPAKLDYVKPAIRKAIGVCGKCPVIVPEHVFSTYCSLFKNRINDISPVMLAEILKQKPNYKCMTDREKNELLAYLISDGDTTKLEGLDLLLLASAEWGTFKQNGSLKYVCSEIEVNMFQGNGHHFIMPYEKLDQRSKDVMRFICDKKNYPIKDIDDDFLKKLLLETIQSHLGKELIITENINLNLDWLREVWNATTYRGIQRYLDVPIFPVLESGSFESNYQVKLVPLHNTNLLLKKVHTNIREQCLDDELEKCLRLLGITIVTQLPSWLLSDSIMDFVMFPSNDDVKEILQKTARIIDQEAIHVFNEKASDSNRARFLDFLAHVCPLNGDLLHLLQQLRLFMSIRPPGTFVCAQSSTFFVRESEKDQFPVNIQYPDHCILVKKSDEVIAELLGCTHMTLCTFMQLKLNGVQLDVFTNDSKHVILYFLKNIDKFDNVIDTASEIPFIKNTVGQSVKPSEVFDPFDEFLKRLFHGEDVFPSAVDDIRPYRNAFIKLGMKRMSEIRSEDVYNVAKSIDSRSKKGENICEKAKALQEFLEQNSHVLYQTVHTGETLGQAIKDMSCFLYSSPDKCGLHIRYPKQLKCFSITSPVCPPQEMKAIQFWELVCSSMPLIQTQSNELSLFYGWNEPPESDQIILQLQNLQKCSISSDMRPEVMSMIKTVYQVLSKDYNQKVKDDIVSNGLIWTDDAFLSPSKVVVFKKDDDIDLKPYMHFLPPELELMHTFFEWLGCRSCQDELVIISVLKVLKEKHENTNYSPAETKKDLKCAVSILDRLAEIKVDSAWANANVFMIVKSKSELSIKFATLTECVYVDNPKCIENVVNDESLCYVHEQISRCTAERLGVKFITPQALKVLQIMRVHTHAIPFGQREDLTTRLNGILKDYPCDESIMKELIQNADDAGAHEIHFIKYFESKNVGRTLEHDSVLKPALCVYNDTCFKKDDFVGIQELGIGGKGNKSFKIGRFGIGFNAVYHITDIPSFLTKGPGLKGRGQVCLFDPLLKHIRDLTGGEPGVRYNVDDLIEEFPDTVVGFPYMTNTCGTMFRLPLRQEESKISKNCLKPLDVELMLQHFIKTMPECLHFAKNIRTIKVMTYSKGKYKCEYEVKSEITQEDEQRRNSFFESVKEHATSLESNQINVEYTMRINVNKKKQSTIWLIANQFGSCFPLEQNDEMTAMTERGLLPIGGVSIKLCENPWQVIAALSKDGAKCRSWQPVNGCAYCFLPLPISTGLPFHVNGHFQLDRGRRNLWNQGYGKKWNEFILSIVVSGALKNALTFLQKYLLNDYLHMDELQEEILRRKYLQMYFCHFPRHQMDGVSEWAFFVTEFYRLMIRTRMRLFPFFSQNVNGLQSVGNVHNQRVVEWVHLSTDVENLDGGVVNTLFKWSYCHETEKQELRFVENILRKLFIKVSDTDKAVVADIEKSIKESIIRTTPHVLMQILKARFETVDLGVENCVFETAAGVHIILKFISQYDRFVDEIEGLPLCLTNDNVVRRFRTLQDVFCSQFCDLMPGSSSLFLHKDLVFLLNSDEMFSKNIFKRFTVRSLVSLLPSSFDPEIFCKDENVRWKSDEFELVEPQTIYRLFKFLYEESFVSKHTILPRFNKKLFLENVTALSNWSFLPSQRKSRCLDTFELIPINQSYTLLSDTHLCEEVTKKVLQKMELPSLDNAVLTDPLNLDVDLNFAANYLTSYAYKANDLLRCLHYHRRTLNENGLTRVDAKCVLRYFNNNIDVLQSCSDEATQLLKELPLYETVHQNLLVSINKNATVIVLENEIPCAGLDELTGHQNIILLEPHEDLKEIYGFLKLSNVSSIDMYIEHILPNIMHMEGHHWLSHIRYIKDNLIHFSISKELSSKQKQLVNLIREIPFININGLCFCANQLYDGNHCVFQQMIDPGLYLPSYFNDWMCFMKLVGLNKRPSGDMMLAFAKRIAHEGSLQMTQDLIASSNVLVEYLLGPAGKKFGDKTYSEISRVEFVVSYTVSSELATICQPYSSSEAFICFEESCDSQFEDICWTSVPLLLNMPKKTKYCKLLGIKQEPDVDSVIRHCQNICDILKKDFEKKHSNINNKQQIMENIYKFLLKKQDKINPSRLIETPIILIPNETMVKASLVILRQSVGQEIKPYLYQAPEIYRHCFDLFKKMGATAEASCWQYANVLSTIKKHFMENELHDGALEKASIAIKHMFAILSIAQDKSTQFDGVNVLYLPNCKRVLTKSNELTVCDNDGFRKKLEIPCQLNFFIGFQQLEIDLKDPVEPFMNLPKNLQPRVLSQDVTEIVSTDDMQEDDNNEDALSYERLFYSQAFHEGLCRLLRHQNGKNNTIIWKEEDDTHLKSTLSKVRIKAVTGLKTLLVFKGELIPGVSIEKPYYVDEVRDDDTSLVGDNTGLAFHLYYQRGETHRVHLFNRASIQSAGLWQLVERCTRGLLEKEESYLVHSLLNLRNNPEYISECLDEHQIRAYGTVDELSVFPQPGSYVEEKFFPFLVQQIQPIPEHSYRFVALEIGNDDEDDETRQPTFIYAHVHRKVSTTNTSVLSINYEVDSGIGVQYAGRSVVPIFRLYLFLPQKQDTTTDIEVFDTEPVTSMPFNETCERIMSMLQEAFEHLSLQDRKRIIRRLIIKWHPDKNLGNEEYTTRVLNFIRHCIVRLERGENLIMNVEPSAPDMRASTYWNTCAAAYNTGQVFAACYNNNVDDYRSHRSFSHRQTHRDPVCSPGEFKRWIKQAKLDFLTGQAHLNCTEKHPETYNWICYICHQACEKALKAAWFLKDANRCPIREHSLVDIANGLDQNIADEAHSFEQQLRIRGCYAKLRYPDSVNSCQVPSDVFSKDEAEFAVTTAKSIMEMVDALSG